MTIAVMMRRREKYVRRIVFPGPCYAFYDIITSTGQYQPQRQFKEQHTPYHEDDGRKGESGTRYLPACGDSCCISSPRTSLLLFSVFSSFEIRVKLSQGEPHLTLRLDQG